MEEEVVDDIIRLHAAGLAKFFDLEGIKSRMTPFQEGENDEDIPVMTTPSSTTITRNQVMKGPIMRSRAKKLQQQVNLLIIRGGATQSVWWGSHPCYQRACPTQPSMKMKIKE